MYFNCYIWHLTLVITIFNHWPCRLAFVPYQDLKYCFGSGVMSSIVKIATMLMTMLIADTKTNNISYQKHQIITYTFSQISWPVLFGRPLKILRGQFKPNFPSFFFTKFPCTFISQIIIRQFQNTYSTILLKALEDFKSYNCSTGLHENYFA